ncbi:hypothetical protein ACFXHA_41405 [Nocardia sp. NPDC059240]|uniref:hypothetical protein n=1 Tax=Nocardia sp. NPDC059240 TaxID=3346786 RepID=UPI00368C4B1F
MNHFRTMVAGALAGAALSLPAAALGAGIAAADTTPDASQCQTGQRTPTADPFTYDSCIHDEWGNLRQCPPFTVVAQAPDGDVRCIPQ